ncbi:metallophosphoesterase [Natrialbaceae archaeon A-gly3]
MTEVDVPVSVADRAAYLPTADALVVADLHLGRAAASSVDAPVGADADVIARLEGLLERFEPTEVVLAGDLLHSFSRVPHGVEEAVGNLEAIVEDAGEAVVATPGNHDSMLEAVYDGETTTAHRLEDGTVVLHGHEPPEATAGRYVVGHDHPALSVDGRKRPCLLYGPDEARGETLWFPPLGECRRLL